MGSETFVDDGSLGPSGGRRVAVRLAGAGALAWLIQIGLWITGIGLNAVHPVAAVLRATPLAIGAWGASRAEGRRVRLGLALVATWGGTMALTDLTRSVAAVLSAGPVSMVPRELSVYGPRALASALGVGALVAALVALPAIPGRRALDAVGRRRAGAAAVALWAVASPGLLLVAAVSQPQGRPGPFLPNPSAVELVPLAVLVVIAVVVWRHDDVAVVVPVVMIAISAVLFGIPYALAPGLGEIGISVLGADITVWARLAAAALLVAVAVALLLSARSSWRSVPP